MKKLTVDKIEDGMVLGREVCGNSGNVLLSKGTPLSAALGRRLVNWGVSAVYIEGEGRIISRRKPGIGFT